MFVLRLCVELIMIADNTKDFVYCISICWHISIYKARIYIHINMPTLDIYEILIAIGFI